MLTNQQIFDAIVGHAAQMPGRSANHAGCLYRTPDGTNACFIGCLLTDEEAKRLDKQPASAIDHLMREEPYLVPERLRTRDHARIEFLRRVQTVHDDYQPDEWAEELRGIAQGYGLDTTVLTEVFPHV